MKLFYYFLIISAGLASGYIELSAQEASQRLSGKSVVEFADSSQAGNKNSQPDKNWQFDDHDLSEALKQIAKYFDFDLFYADRLTAGKRVSKTLPPSHFSEILSLLLEGSDLKWELVAEGQVIIVARQTIFSLKSSGEIIDAKNGQFLRNVSVSQSSDSVGTYSDQCGRYSLALNTELPCTLRFNHVGYKEEIRIIREPPTDSISMRIAMRQAIHPSKPVKVEIPSYGAKIRPGKAALEPDFTGQLAAIPAIAEASQLSSIQDLPGLHLSGRNASVLSYRNSPSSQNLILIDGIPLQRLDHSFGLMSVLSQSAIENISVHHGFYPARFGGRLSNVIEVSLPQGDLQELSIRTGVNSMNSTIQVSLPLFSHGSFFTSFRKSLPNNVIRNIYSDQQESPQSSLTFGGIFPNSGPDSIRVYLQALGKLEPNAGLNGPHFNFYNNISKLTLTPGKRDIISFSFFKSGDQLYKYYRSREFSLVQNADYYEYSNLFALVERKVDWQAFALSGNWTHEWSRRTHSSLRFISSENKKIYRESVQMAVEAVQQAPTNQSDTLSTVTNRETGTTNWLSEQQLKGSLFYRLNDNHDFEAGFSASSTKVSSDALSRIQESQISDLEKSATLAHSLAVYLQDTWQYSSRLRLLPGIRTNYYRPLGRWYFEPRFSMQYFLKENLLLNAGWGRYTQFLNQVDTELWFSNRLENWTLAGKNSDTHSQAENFVVGLQLNQQPGSIDIEFYRNRQNNVIEYTQRLEAPNKPGIIVDHTRADTRTMGLDIKLHGSCSWFTGWVGFTARQTRTRLAGLPRGDTFLSAESYPYQLKSAGIFTWNGWNFSSAASVYSGRPYTSKYDIYQVSMGEGNRISALNAGDINADKLRPHYRVDLAISRQISHGILSSDLKFSVYNIFNNTPVSQRHLNVESSLVQNSIIFNDIKWAPRIISLSLEVAFNE